MIYCFLSFYYYYYYFWLECNCLCLRWIKSCLGCSGNPTHNLGKVHVEIFSSIWNIIVPRIILNSLEMTILNQGNLCKIYKLKIIIMITPQRYTWLLKSHPLHDLHLTYLYGCCSSARVRLCRGALYVHALIASALQSERSPLPLRPMSDWRALAWQTWFPDRECGIKYTGSCIMQPQCMWGKREKKKRKGKKNRGCYKIIGLHSIYSWLNKLHLGSNFWQSRLP